MTTTHMVVNSEAGCSGHRRFTESDDYLIPSIIKPAKTVNYIRNSVKAVVDLITAQLLFTF